MNQAFQPARPTPKVFVVAPPPLRPQLVQPIPASVVVLDESPLLHTLGHVNCAACHQRSLVRSEIHLADMKFRVAFTQWMSARVVRNATETSVRYIKPESERTYNDYAVALEKFFGHLRLRDIHDGHLRTYQDNRAANDGTWTRTCGQNRIRKEIGLLRRMMQAAGVWTEDIANSFVQLPKVETDVQRVLEPQEQERLLRITLAKKEWLWVYDYIVLALHTCAGSQELRTLRLKDVDVNRATIRIGVEASKNKFRNRTIPLEDEAVMLSLARLIERARRFGSHRPEHHLFPYGGGSRRANSDGDGDRGALDVCRPMSKWGLMASWKEIRKATGLHWLRPYDLRHTAVTRMAEEGIPIAKIMAFAGHISPKMNQHYTTISMQAKRETARLMWRKAEAQVSDGGAK